MIVLNEIDNIKCAEFLKTQDELNKIIRFYKSSVKYLNNKVDFLINENISLRNELDDTINILEERLKKKIIKIKELEKQLDDAKVEYTELENCLSEKIMEIKKLERHENINYYNKYVYYKRISDTYEIELQERNRYIKALEEENAMLLDEIEGAKDGHK